MKWESDNFENIVVEDIPLIDLRAPVEFLKGAVPTAVNLPILDDEQRHKVGICYRKKGSEAAVELGGRLVSGGIKQLRIAAWKSFIEKNPNALIYCFRGGKRSQISQEWLLEEGGLSIPRLAGGYKALRNYLLDQLSPSKQTCTPVLLGGRTGTGKTIILNQCANSIDLEGLANHRGSTFGRFLTPQPSQIDFENSLAWNVIQHRHRGYEWLVLEDEGRYVGSRNIPRDIADFFNGGNLILLEISLEERLEIIFDEYVTGGQHEHRSYYGPEEGLHQWFAAMIANVERIQKRLGSERTTQVKRLMEMAQKHQLETSVSQRHRDWLEVLMCEYYDPMYDYQMAKKKRPIIFKGNTLEVKEYLKALEPLVDRQGTKASCGFQGVS